MRNTVRQLLVVLGLIFIASRASAAVLLWPVDGRTGVTQVAEQSEWAQFIVASGSDVGFLSPTDEGLANYYSVMLTDTPEVARLREGAGLAGAEGSVWVRLDAFGALWVFANAEGSSSINTDAGSAGLTQGINWVRQQLGLGAALTESAASPMTAPVMADPNFIYRDPGVRVQVSGVLDTSDYLRLTKGIGSLQGVSFVYPGKLSGSDVELIVGTQTDAFTLDRLLSQQPWLQPQGSGQYRWNALGADL